MLFDRVLTNLILASIYLHLVQAIVQFSFNRADLAITEGEDLPSLLIIIKNGQHEANISFQVLVVPGTAQDDTDYLSNTGEPYVFTRNTNQLPIRTELQQDRSGEEVESFMICLPNAQVLQSMGAVPVEPLCATITIIDDDSVVIGFRSPFQTVIEGETVTVCVDVKPQGLPLDPFDRIRLPLRITPVVRETILSTNSLLFESSIVRCATLSIVDNDILEGSRSYQLILESNGDSTVPVLLYPNTTLIIVIDNDRQDTSFSIYSPQRVISVLEGGRTENISVQKSSSSALSYNVSLVFTHLTRLEGVAIPKSLIFDPSTTRKAVDIVTMDDTIPGDRIEFNISIGSVVVIEAPGDTMHSLASALGGPVKIVIYDNDFEIGFMNDEFLVPEDSSNADVCIGIIAPETSSDIEPSLAIPIQVILENATSCNLTLDRDHVVLSANNKMDCLTVTHSGGCNRARSYTIRLSSTITIGQKYTVYSYRQNASISVISVQDLENESQLSSGEIAAIIAPLTLVACFTLVIITAIVRKLKYRTESDDKKNSEKGHNPEYQKIPLDHICGTISKNGMEEYTSETLTPHKPADKEETLLPRDIYSETKLVVRKDIQEQSSESPTIMKDVYSGTQLIVTNDNIQDQSSEHPASLRDIYSGTESVVRNDMQDQSSENPASLRDIAIEEEN